MKWVNTQQWIDTSNELYAIAIKYCSLSSRLHKVSIKDRETTYKLLCSMDPNGVVEELESYMSCNKTQDWNVFDVWANKLRKRLTHLCSLDNILSGRGETEEQWTAFRLDHRILVKESVDDFLWMLADSMEYKFHVLHSLAGSITDAYGLGNDTDFIVGLIRKMPKESDMDENQSIKKKAKSISFSDIIQYDDKERLLKRFHVLIDGRSGADVGCVILRALQENYITRLPTQKEYESEFERIGSWTAIHNYMNDKNLNALDRANKIVFFS